MMKGSRQRDPFIVGTDPMAEAQFKRMTVGEFFDWHERQEYRYELVNGFPIQSLPPKGMIWKGTGRTSPSALSC